MRGVAFFIDAISRISKRQPGGKVISKGRRLETGAEAAAHSILATSCMVASLMYAGSSSITSTS